MGRIAKILVAKPSLRRLALACLSYAAFYLALFAQLPFKGALHGNCDTVVALALSNTYIAKAAAFLGLGSAGSAMFPASNVLAYGEAAPGMSAIYVLFRLFGFDDIFASYFFIASVFSLTAVGAYVFAGLFLRSFTARLFAGYAFTCSNMMFAHIDDSAIIFYLFPLLSLTFLVRFFRERDSRLLTAAALLGAAQIYFSVYVFAYQSVLILFFIAIYQNSRLKRVPWSEFLKPAMLYALVASPLLVFYIVSLRTLDIVSPFESEYITRVMSWMPSDIFWATRNNVLYGGPHSVPQEWHVVRHFNFIGLLVVTTAIGAMMLRGRHRVLLGGVGLIGLMLAMGPVLTLTTTDLSQFAVAKGIPTPLFPLYEWIPIFRFHRIPVRAYFLVLLAISILSSVTLQWVLNGFRGQRLNQVIVVAFFAAFHFLENVPMPMPAYAELGGRLELPHEYRTFLATARSDGLVLDLPSRLGLKYPDWNPHEFQDLGEPGIGARIKVNRGSEIVNSDKDIFLYNREAIYHNWQTQHRRDVINGANGYFPATRLIFDRWIEDLPDERALRWLKRQGVAYLVFHKGLVLWGEQSLLDGLSSAPLLRQVFAGEDIVVFEFR